MSFIAYDYLLQRPLPKDGETAINEYVAAVHAAAQRRSRLP